MILQARDVEFNDVRIRVFEGPANGPELLLLHGLTGRHDSFEPVISGLVDRFHVFAIDQRGHGESAHIPGKYAITDYSDDLCRVIQSLEVSPVLVWGQSLGAGVALRAAGHNPELFKALILEDPPLQWSSTDSPLASVFERWHELAVSDLTVDEIEAELSSLDTASIGAATRYKAETLWQLDSSVLKQAISGRIWEADRNPEAELHALKAPTLLLQADPSLGGILEDEVIEELSPLPSNIEHIKCQGAGHKIHASQPELALQLALAFLNRVP